ncbi:hypothetical protein H5410_026101 [Solanum commersonii]|uniref:Uncharacterized protein n=1 Tax=Solanum commersonii TaxID=4109 RepID=A0A9J5YVL3_SOLCO|nr:hypothetical protein H5410_026101 [Solanum commersonii]
MYYVYYGCDKMWTSSFHVSKQLVDQHAPYFCSKSRIARPKFFFRTIHNSSINSSILDSSQIISRISSFTSIIIIRDQLSLFFFVLKFIIYNLLHHLDIAPHSYLYPLHHSDF